MGHENNYHLFTKIFHCLPEGVTNIFSPKSFTDFLEALVPVEIIEKKILLIRGLKVMLDADEVVANCDHLPKLRLAIVKGNER